MADEEGSVMVDGQDFETDDQELENTTNEELQEEAQTTEDNQGNPVAPENEQPQYTEKGTKLDPDPMSALNQQLANERAKARQYEALLNDPQKVKAYLEELEKEHGGQTPAEGEIRPEQIQTVDDLHRYLAQERAKDRREVEQLKGYIGQFSQVQGVLAVGDRIRNEIDQVRQKYPEFNPQSPQYDEELEKALGDAYEEIDYDPNTGTFRGQVSLLRLADRFISAARRGEKQGSRRAQTSVVDRRIGRVRSGAKEGGDEVDESKLSPSQTIAARMQRAYRRVR